MLHLPNADRAVVDPRKLTHYLLDPTHLQGGAGKAGFFARFGFRADAWEVLRDALLDHARAHAARATRTTVYGETYEIHGPIATPDGRNPTVVVV